MAFQQAMSTCLQQPDILFIAQLNIRHMRLIVPTLERPYTSPHKLRPPHRVQWAALHWATLTRPSIECMSEWCCRWHPTCWPLRRHMTATTYPIEQCYSLCTHQIGHTWSKLRMWRRRCLQAVLWLHLGEARGGVTQCLMKLRNGLHASVSLLTLLRRCARGLRCKDMLRQQWTATSLWVSASREGRHWLGGQGWVLTQKGLKLRAALVVHIRQNLC